MDDKELADKVASLLDISMLDDQYFVEPLELDWLKTSIWLPAGAFVRDWRVAGALMERCDFVQIDRVPDEHGAEGWMVCTANHMKRQQHAEDDSLTRAIIESCVTALEQS